MKIVFIPSFHVNYSIGLVNALAQDHEVCFITREVIPEFGNTHLKYKKYLEERVDKRVKIIYIKFYRLIDPRRFLIPPI